MNPERRLSKGERIHNRREKAAHRDDDLRARMAQQTKDAAAKRTQLAAEEAERNRQRHQEETRRAQIRKQEIDVKLQNLFLSYDGSVQSLDDTEPPTILEYAELGIERTWLWFKLGEIGRERHADELGDFLQRLPFTTQYALEEQIRGEDGKPISRMTAIRDRVLTPEDLQRYTRESSK